MLTRVFHLPREALCGLFIVVFDDSSRATQIIICCNLDTYTLSLLVIVHHIYIVAKKQICVHHIMR